jgi:hypothetical protein
LFVFNEAICVEPYQRMSRILIVRARIDRLAGARLRFGNLILGLERPAAR